MAKHPRVAVVILALSLVLFAFLGLFSATDPTSYSPKPMLVVISAWVLSYAAVLIPAVLFFLWNPNLLVRQQSTLPKRTIGLVALLSVLTLAEFETVWKDAIQYQGPHHTIAVFAINMLWLAILWWAVVRTLRRPSFGANLLSHWLLFAWLGWYAFPFLGAPIYF